MGKNDFLTPKAIANRIKAKGLQKLRWYCQMCRKQCRDENGFKCHCMSESHQRQMQVFGQNPERFVDGYSEEFEESFLEHVRRTHRFSRVAATVVYNEYIADRHHVHMNSTQWATLTEFIKHLGRIGKCKVEETEKGWFMTYIDREPETLFKENLKNKRQCSDLADEERHERMIAEQIERAAKTAKPTEKAGENSAENSTSINPNEKEMTQSEKVAFSLSSSSSSQPKSTGSRFKPENTLKATLNLGDDDDKTLLSNKTLNQARGSAPPGSSALDEIMLREMKTKEKVNRKDYWLCEDIVVKVVSSSVIDKGYYKKKGVVRRVVDKYVGVVEMLDSGDILKVDQAELETVIPQVGGLVKIVNGAYCGLNARLLSINETKFSATVEIEKGLYNGRVIKGLEYEDICKVIAV